MKYRKSEVGERRAERRVQAAQDLRLARETGGLIDDQAAAIALAISRPTWWRLVREYGVTPVKLGRATRWRLEDVDRLVERLAQGEGGVG